VETDVGEEEAVEDAKREVIFMVGSPNSNNQQAADVRIEKRVM